MASTSPAFAASSHARVIALSSALTLVVIAATSGVSGGGGGVSFAAEGAAAASSAAAGGGGGGGAGCCFGFIGGVSGISTGSNAGARSPHIFSYAAWPSRIFAFASARPARKASLSGSIARPARYAFTASPPCPKPVSAAPLRPYPFPHFGAIFTHRFASASASSYFPHPLYAADRLLNRTWLVLSNRIAIVNCFAALA